MARFTLYRLAGGRLVLDLQTDLIRTPVRVVAPLVPCALAPPLGAVHPQLDLEAGPHTLVTTEMAGLPATLLDDPVLDLSHEAGRIGRALDLLLGEA